MLPIAIPSSGRPHHQTTLKALPQSLRHNVFLVVREREYESYKHLDVEGHNLLMCPNFDHIGQKRQWICERFANYGKVLMMDDDLTFAVRRTDEPTKFRAAEPHDLEGMIHAVDGRLREYAMVAVAMREGANRRTELIVLNTRITRVHGYDLNNFHKMGYSFTRQTLMTDFDVTLQHLTNGQPTATLNWWVQNQGSSNAPGGCSAYRNLDDLGRAAEQLAEKYPGIVKVTEKETKTAWGGGKRKDVTIYWKKAFAYGTARRGEDNVGEQAGDGGI